ncbi:U-box domain-containing protein 34-like [Rhodamnia argentea]|uniref:RING-type E3 ubiquitin transferase n=1 Tax=Rhodamnia argentea TaxID=178133 RepID=A0A8B8P7Y6_9MYRT|nr:U-box domain-containing protein 34-like [Rhodamnia argentea]
MSTTGGGDRGAPPAMSAMAVAVKGDLSGFEGGRGSRRAVRWAIENLMPRADRFVLVHVMPRVTSIPTPSGDRIPVAELDENVVAMYVEETKVKFEQVFVPFKKMCKPWKVETVVLEADNPAAALLQYVSNSGINNLVLGSCSSNAFGRKLKGAVVPATVLTCAPETCDVYVISRNNIVNKSDKGSSHGMLTQTNHKDVFGGSSNAMSWTNSVCGESDSNNSFRGSPPSEPSFVTALASGYTDYPDSANVNQESRHLYIGDAREIDFVQQSTLMASRPTEQSDVQAEIEKLRRQLEDTVSMYERTCEELVHAQNKVQVLSSECGEDARRVNSALQREETLRQIAAEERAKYMEALKEVEEAKSLLAKEAYERQIAELNALKESLEKQKIMDMLLSSDKRYRRYTRDELELATNSFSENYMIGEGAYGKVYKCNLDHTPVAVKVLQSDACERKEEFLREVEVLSQLRHPHLVLLLGACPEIRGLVYEYMENGSLEEHIYRQNGKPSLPWFVRFQITFEVACGLAFLHNSKPVPIVHRDLKPGNILLGKNYVSKIGDVGLAKLISDVVPDNITEYRDSMLAGTIYYMDPEYQRTGTIRPKSDLYAFGIIILQLLMGCHPNGLLLKAEEAIERGSLASILDNTVKDWPVAETEKLAQIALKCSKLRCRDRPDLENEVLPVLKKLSDFANAKARVERENACAPSHYFCPILQEVMQDPYIAADGFTYEHRAIKAWFEKHRVSPVTRKKLQHTVLVPNQTLRSAIHDWRSRVTYEGNHD